MKNVELGPAGMAQDKSAEIIKFNGPGEAPEVDVAPETVTEPSADTGPEIDAPAPSLEEAGAGGFLAQARHRAKLTIEKVSEATKVKAEHLEAIEWMRLDRLPALPYATGFVKAYARYLGLDAETVAAHFKVQANAQAAASAEISPAPQASVAASSEGANLGSVFAMLAVALFALWIGYQVLTGGNRDADVRQTAAPESSTPVEVRNTQIAERPELVALPPAEETAEPNDVAEEEALDALTLAEASTESVEAARANEMESALATQTGIDAERIETPPPTEPPAEPQSASEPSSILAAAEAAPVQTERRERPLPRRARPTPAPEPVRAAVIVEANLTRSTSPDYPNGCTRGASAIESVTIIFDVSAGGRAVNSRVASSTNGCFESEALQTLTRWRFDPRTVDGRAVAESGKRATLNFKK